MEIDGRLRTQLSKVLSRLERYEDLGESCIFTDDKAPVELLGMKMIDGIIKEEIEYYQGIYHERGLKGLMEMLL